MKIKAEKNVNRFGLTGKLLLINLMIFVMFGVFLTAMVTSFGDLKAVTSELMGNGVGRVVRNAQIGRALFSVMDRANLLIGTFFRDDNLLRKNSRTLTLRTDHLQSFRMDPRLKSALADFQSQLSQLLHMSFQVNEHNQKLSQSMTRLEQELLDLERLVEDRLFYLHFFGDDTTFLQKYIDRFPKLEHLIQKASLMFTGIDPVRSDTRDIKPIVDVFDDLLGEIRDLPRYEPSIEMHVNNLFDATTECRSLHIDFNNAIIDYRDQLGSFNSEKAEVMAVMETVDRDIENTYRNMWYRTSKLMENKFRFVFLLSGLVTLLFGVTAYVFILRNIRRPIQIIRNGLASIGAGNLDTRLRLYRKDEWNLIETAVNRMAADLKASHGELKHREAELQKAHRELTMSLAELEAEIDQRKTVEEALKREHDLMERIVEASPACIMVIDRDGRITFASDRAEELFGFPKEELLRRTIFDPQWRRTDHEGEPIPPGRSPFQRVIDAGEPVFDMGVSVAHARGHRIHLSVNAAPLFNEAGDIHAVVEVVNDITRRKQDEAEREKLHLQLVQAQKMEAVGTLAGGIAHDFNNLLQGIQGYAELLLLTAKPETPAHKNLQAIRAAAERGGEMTRRILTFARKVDVHLQPVDLNLELANVKRLLERTIPRMIEIRHVSGPDLKPVMADPVQIEQVIMNLAFNAKDAMPGGGLFLLETRNVCLGENYSREQAEIRPGEYVLLQVSDTGEGMDEAVRAQVFDPFFTTKETGKGTGLGLAMVFGIVKYHGGHIVCSSEKGKGTTFEIYLPVTDTDHTPESTRPPVNSHRGSETILVVDDEDYIREFVEQALSRFGYETVTAPDGETAVQIFQENHPEINLVLLDLNMPGMGGMQCLQRLLAIDPSADIVVSTGFTFNGSMKDAVDAGAKGYITKPYQLRSMMEVIRRVLHADGSSLPQGQGGVPADGGAECREGGGEGGRRDEQDGPQKRPPIDGVPEGPSE